MPTAINTTNANGGADSSTHSSAGVHEVLLRFYATLQSLLDHHYMSFFSRTENNLLSSILEKRQQEQQHEEASSGSDGGGSLKEQSLMALGLCMNFIVQGLQRPEPDLVRRVIEVLTYLNDSSPSRLFGRQEFQGRYRTVILQVLLSLVTLRPGQGADVVATVESHAVAGNLSVSSSSSHSSSTTTVASTSSSSGSQELLRDEIALLIHKVVTAEPASEEMVHGSVLLQQLITQMVASSVSIQETLWRSLVALCDSTQCSQGLEDLAYDLKLIIQQTG
ncbi:hypothetical protein DFQ26_006284 [Actinomortierella ambigua]|nr:hypothetical protein DFQ26_006284 [Actinomortierella ambigua]